MTSAEFIRLAPFLGFIAIYSAITTKVFEDALDDDNMKLASIILITDITIMIFLVWRLLC